MQLYSVDIAMTICVHLLMYWACSSHTKQESRYAQRYTITNRFAKYINKIMKFDSTNLFTKNLLSVTDRCVTLIQACSYHHSNLVVLDLSSTVSSVTMFMFRVKFSQHAPVMHCMLNNIIYCDSLIIMFNLYSL